MIIYESTKNENAFSPYYKKEIALLNASGIKLLPTTKASTEFTSKECLPQPPKKYGYTLPIRVLLFFCVGTKIQSIAHHATPIVCIPTPIACNTTSIVYHATPIAYHATYIIHHATPIVCIPTPIAYHTTSIVYHTTPIAYHATYIVCIPTPIVYHTTSIAYHATSIACNTTCIVRHTIPIACNTTCIVRHTIPIASTITCIAYNTTPIALASEPYFYMIINTLTVTCLLTISEYNLIASSTSERYKLPLPQV